MYIDECICFKNCTFIDKPVSRILVYEEIEKQKKMPAY